MQHQPVRVHAQRPGKGLQVKQSESLRTQTRPYKSQIKTEITCLQFTQNHIQLVRWTFNNYEVNIFKVLAMIQHRFHVEN